MSASTQLAEKLPMRQEFTASLAIKSPSGMGFGTAYWMQGDRIAFTTELELEKDDRIEIRMELTGFNDSALGEILLLQTREEDSGMLTCLGQIMEMPREDFEMLNQWLENLIAGNTASQSSRWLASITHSRGPQASQDETAAALRRMDKRMGNDSRTASITPSIAPISHADNKSDARKRIGRQAIRAALRASVNAGSQGERTESAAPPNPETAPVPASPAPTPAPGLEAKSPVPEPKHEPAAPQPPQISPPVSAQPHPPEAQAAPPAEDNTVQVGIRARRGEDGSVHLSWANAQSLIHTWKQGLKGGVLTLPVFPNAPAAGESVKFRFSLPDGEKFTLRGSIKQSDDSGLVCSIRIPWGTRIKLLRIQEAN